MKSYQHAFIQLALKSGALKFGEFQLKSGRISPYFFNAGMFHTGTALSQLGTYYAAALLDSDVKFDMLFGPAYKGIPLATTTAIALANQHTFDVPYSYNRKEAKEHGEGGTLVGAPLEGRVVIIDDVITAGTAIKQALNLLNPAKATAAAILIGLNRQEKGDGETSAIYELQQATGVPVISIINLDDILDYLVSEQQDSTALKRIQHYRLKYGV